MQILEQVMNFLANNKASIISVLGFVWVFVAKAFSNVNANPVVAALQKALDMVAKIAEVVGKLAEYLSEILAQVIKSDGFLGKK